MNRRAMLAAAVAGLTVQPATGRAPGNGEQLRSLIESVIAKGDTSGLDKLVTEDVTIPGANVTGIDAFRAASDAGHISRTERYTEMTFDILSLAEADEWAHALVRFEGITKGGQTEERYVFYVARVDGGLIAELYL